MNDLSLEKLHHISTLLIETGNSGYAEQVDKAILAVTSMQATITELEEQVSKMNGGRSCKICGQDYVIAEIGERMGFRVDVALRDNRKLQATITEWQNKWDIENRECGLLESKVESQQATITELAAEVLRQGYELCDTGNKNDELRLLIKNQQATITELEKTELGQNAIWMQQNGTIKQQQDTITELRGDLEALWRIDTYSDDQNEFRDLLNKYAPKEMKGD